MSDIFNIFESMNLSVLSSFSLNMLLNFRLTKALLSYSMALKENSIYGELAIDMLK